MCAIHHVQQFRSFAFSSKFISYIFIEVALFVYYFLELCVIHLFVSYRFWLLRLHVMYGMMALCSCRSSGSVLTCKTLMQLPISTFAYCPVLACWFRLGTPNWYQALIQNRHLKCRIINRFLSIMSIYTLIFIQSFIQEYILTYIPQRILSVIFLRQQRTIISIAWLFIRLRLSVNSHLLSEFDCNCIPIAFMFNQMAPFIDCAVNEVFSTVVI